MREKVFSQPSKSQRWIRTADGDMTGGVGLAILCGGAGKDESSLRGLGVSSRVMLCDEGRRSQYGERVVLNLVVWCTVLYGS